MKDELICNEKLLNNLKSAISIDKEIVNVTIILTNYRWMVFSKRNVKKPKEFGPYFISEINEITEKDVVEDKGVCKLYLILVQFYDHIEKKKLRNLVFRFDKKDVQE